MARDETRRRAVSTGSGTADKMDRLTVHQRPSVTSSSSSLLFPASRTPSYRRSVALPRRQADRPARRSTISAVLALGRRASLSRFLSEQREMRATVRMAIIIACFCGMWVGFFVVYVVSGWCPSTICPVPPSLSTFFFWLGYSNSAVNPVLYAIFNDDFRKSFMCILGCGRAWHHQLHLDITMITTITVSCPADVLPCHHGQSILGCGRGVDASSNTTRRRTSTLAAVF